MAERKKTIDRIIEGAARVFSDKGYEGATTREIAATAGVNEVTLFRHFGTKKGIFLAVIERFSARPGLEEAMEKRMTGDLRRDLIILGLHFYKTITARRKQIIMTLDAAERLPEIRDAVFRTPEHQNGLLAAYLRDQMKRGVIRPLSDPGLAAQAFFGMLFEHAIRAWLLPRKTKQSPETIAAAYVEIFLRGIGADA